MDENGRVNDTNTPICKLCLNDVHAAHEILLIYSHTSRTTTQSNIGKLSKASSTQNDKSQITIENCIVQTKLINTRSYNNHPIIMWRVLYKEFILLVFF